MSSELLQLNPPIELNTPRGHALAHFLWMGSPEGDPCWCCFGGDGQIWWWPNPMVRAIRNVSHHRPNPELPPRVTTKRKRKRR